MSEHRGWLTAALLAGIVVGSAWSSIASRPLWADETDPPPAARVGDVISFATKSSQGTELFVIIDAREKILSVYEFDSRKGKLKLSAVRHYAADHQLAEFNNEAPFVADIEKLVRTR